MRRHETSRSARLLVLFTVMSFAAPALAGEPSTPGAPAAFDPTDPKVVRAVADVVACGNMSKVWPIERVLARLPALHRKIIDELVGRLTDESIDPERRRYAAIGLAQISRSDQVALDGLIAALGSEHVHLRRGAAEAIGRLAWDLSGWPEPNAAHAVNALAARAGDPEEAHLVRVAAVEALVWLGRHAAPATVTLLALLRGDNEELAEPAARALYSIAPNDPEVAAALLDRLATAPDKVKIAIASALEEIDTAQAPVVAALRPLLTSDDAEVREDLYEYLRYSPAIHEFVDDLTRLLRHDNLEVRSRALEVLEEWKVTPLPAETVDLLADYLLLVREPPANDNFFEQAEADSGANWPDEDDSWMMLADMILCQGGWRGLPALQRVYAKGGPSARLDVIGALADPQRQVDSFIGFDPMEHPDGRLLMQALSDPDDEVRYLAALGLLQHFVLPDEHVPTVADGMATYPFAYAKQWPSYRDKGLAALSLALSGSKPDATTYALDRTLRYIQCMEATPPKLLPDIVKLLEHSDMSIRWHAAHVLMEIDPLSAAAVEPLCAFLESSTGAADSSETYQWPELAARLLQAGQAPRVVPLLDKLLQHEDRHWRLAALQALGSPVGADEPEELTKLREHAPVVMKDLYRLGDDVARHSVIRALEHMTPTEPVVSLLIDAVSDPSHSISKQAIAALDEFAPAHADRIMRALIDVIRTGDPVPEAPRGKAMTALAGYGAAAADAIPLLLAIALSPDDPHADAASYAWLHIHEDVLRQRTAAHSPAGDTR